MVTEQVMREEVNFFLCFCFSFFRTHTGYKPLFCKYCHRPFGDPSNLNKHMRLHADAESPYKCEICDKILVRRRDLDRHIKSKHQNNVDTTSDTSDDELDV